MNRTNLNYTLGTLALRVDLSTQCLNIRAILFSDKADHIKLHLLLKCLTQESKLTDDTLNMLKKALRSRGADGSRNLCVSVYKEMYFWIKLAQHFPANVSLLLITAESILDVDDELDEAVFYFFKAFDINSEAVGQLSFELQEMLYNSEYRYCYMVYQLKNILVVGDQSELAEFLINFHEEFGNDTEKLEQVQEILNPNSAQTFRCKRRSL